MGGGGGAKLAKGHRRGARYAGETISARKRLITSKFWANKFVARDVSLMLVVHVSCSPDHSARLLVSPWCQSDHQQALVCSQLLL